MLSGMTDNGVKRVTACVAGLVLMSGCAAPSEPEPYAEVDPNTSKYFIALEDEGSGPLTYAGGQSGEDAEFLYNMGLFFCDELDGGSDVDEALSALEENSGLGADSGRVAGAAISGLCPDHRETVEAAIG